MIGPPTTYTNANADTNADTTVTSLHEAIKSSMQPSGGAPPSDSRSGSGQDGSRRDSATTGPLAPAADAPTTGGGDDLVRWSNAGAALLSAAMGSGQSLGQNQGLGPGLGLGATQNQSLAGLETDSNREMLEALIKREDERRMLLRLLEIQQRQKDQASLLAAVRAGLLGGAHGQAGARGLASLGNSNVAGISLGLGGQGALASSSSDFLGDLSSRLFPASSPSSSSPAPGGATNITDTSMVSPAAPSNKIATPTGTAWGILDMLSVTNNPASSASNTSTLEQLLLQQQLLNRLRMNETASSSTIMEPLGMNAQLHSHQQARGLVQPSSSVPTMGGASATLSMAPANQKRKGRTGTFPQKVHQMLADLEKQDGGTDIAAFLQNGRAFIIHKPKEFEETVMPKYFRMGHFSSFQRQLNLYAFHRVTEGPNKGCYYHELFTRDNPALATQIKRVKIKPDSAHSSSSKSMYASSGMSSGPGQQLSTSSLLGSLGPMPSAFGPIPNASTTMQSLDLSGIAGLGLLGNLGAFGLSRSSTSNLDFLSRLGPSGSALGSQQNLEHAIGKDSGGSAKGNLKTDVSSDDDQR